MCVHGCSVVVVIVQFVFVALVGSVNDIHCPVSPHEGELTCVLCRYPQLVGGSVYRSFLPHFPEAAETARV